jgi:hypothetical protein
MDLIRSEKLSAALEKALDTGETAELFDQLRRGSNLPGPQANYDLARAVGAVIARRESKGDRLVADLTRDDDEFRRIVAAMTLAARSLPGGGGDKKRAAARAAEAIAALQELAEDPRKVVRVGITEALRMRLTTMGEPAVADLVAWTDGYLQAHIALQALADKALLAALPSSTEVLARLEEAFVLADQSSRSAERTQGMRVLREQMPAQIAVFAARFPETLKWVEEKTKSTRPETREVIAGAISALRHAMMSDKEAARLSALLEASGKPRRDADRVVAGTRNRGKGRK